MKKTYHAKLFRNGGSQAVRLPRECRLPGTEVLVRIEGRRLILEPIERQWSPRFMALLRTPLEGRGLKRRQPRRTQRDDLRL